MRFACRRSVTVASLTGAVLSAAYTLGILGVWVVTPMLRVAGTAHDHRLQVFGIAGFAAIYVIAIAAVFAVPAGFVFGAILGGAVGATAGVTAVLVGAIHNRTVRRTATVASGATAGSLLGLLVVHGAPGGYLIPAVLAGCFCGIVSGHCVWMVVGPRWLPMWVRRLGWGAQC